MLWTVVWRYSIKMSFFKKKLGKTKSSEIPEAQGEDNKEEVKKKSQKSRRAQSFNLKSDEHKVGNDLENEKEKVQERKKFKDMTGILHGGAQEAVTYPTFNVHYLGRIPTSAEYGREAVEDPVNQLCKLREKQKLQRVFLSFNVEGLFCREVSGPFLKTKKDGFNMHIPLHHITYGVGCAAHPTVFACIAKMNDDPSPENQVLVLHAFVCDKPETTQSITYWQLQAYIEAYEDLKRKRILRARRKQAIEGSMHQKRTGMSDVPEESQTGHPPGQTRTKSHKGKHHVNNNTKPQMTVESSTIPSTKAGKTTKEETPARESPAQQSGQTHQAGPKPQQLPRQQLQSKHSAPQTVKTIIADVHPGEFAGDGPPVSRKPIPPALNQQDSARMNVVQNQRHADSPRPGSGGKHRKSRKNSASGTSTGSAASNGTSSSSSSSGRGSPLPSPGPGKANKTFEKRIDELNTLVNMDAEKLKALMINDHPTLARYVGSEYIQCTSGLNHSMNELRMQRFYLTFCDILHVTHLQYWFFNNMPIELTKISDRYFKIVEYVK